jgi:hypothetical protein
MNVEIGTEASQFPEKEYINEIFLAVQYELATQAQGFTQSPHMMVRVYTLSYLFSTKGIT